VRGRSTIAAHSEGGDNGRPSAPAGQCFRCRLRTDCNTYRQLVNGRQVSDDEARDLATGLIRDLTDTVEIDQELVRHVISRSDRAYGRG
jgi:hypothetical protein